MTLIIQKPTGGRLAFAKTYVGLDDPDAASYITAVEAADTAAGQSGGLETAVKVAIHSFVKGCKVDGIWPAIKASCILAGARTLNGALVPLANASNSAPTLNGTTGGWSYNRKTGVRGNGTNNYINSGRNNNADPQNSKHFGIYLSSATTLFNNARLIAAGDSSGNDLHLATNTTTPGAYRLEINGTGSAADTGVSHTTVNFLGGVRASSTQIQFRASSLNTTFNQTSGTPRSENIALLGRIGETERFTDARLAFYSIGESLNLALLDARVTDLINAIGAAIP